MAETPTKSMPPAAQKRVRPEDRFRYIGFDVFPEKPGEIFKGDAEKSKLVAEAEKRRSTGNTLREDCKLLEERVSGVEKIALTIACVVMILSLFFPFYRSYTEQVVQQEMAAANQTDSKGDEIITATQSRKSYTKTYYSLSGIESLAAIGGAGGKIFSSGIVLILSGVVMLAFTLSCLIVPVMVLRTLYGAKGNADERAVQLKKALRIGWLPLILFVAAVFLSFLGANYGFDPKNGASYGVPNGLPLVSIGDGYSVAALIGTVSIGVYIAIAASLMTAIKGVEI